MKKFTIYQYELVAKELEQRPKCRDCKWFSDGGEFSYCVASPEHKEHNPYGESEFFTKKEKPFLDLSRVDKDSGCYLVEIDDLCHDVDSEGHCGFSHIKDKSEPGSAEIENHRKATESARIRKESK